MATQYYSSKIDWWIILVFGLTLLFFISILLWIGMEWYIVLIISVPIFGIVGLSLTQIQYVIKDQELGIKTMTKWLWFPIDKIKEIKKVKSVLASPALSFTRIAIRFERGVSKWAYPLEISPKDRDKFIHDLLKINPLIKVIQ